MLTARFSPRSPAARLSGRSYAPGTTLRSVASSRTTRVAVRAGFMEDAINGLTVALKNSPLNQGKKALAIAQAGQYDEAAVRAKVQSYIDNNKVVVFSWSGCPFCKKAKGLLSELGAQYTAVELDTLGEEGKAIRAELAKMTDRTSVPNIFVAGRGVGGCNDGPGVMTLHGRGELVPMLKAAEALP